MSNENKIKGFVFYYGFYEALNSKMLDDAAFRRLVLSICEFVFEGKEFEPQTEIERMLWTLMRPQLKANVDRYHNGTKGGRPSRIDRDIVSQMSQKCLTQQQIADELGCSRRQVNRILSEDSKKRHMTKPKKKNKKEKEKEKMSQVTPVKLDKVLKAEMTEKLRS